MGKGWRNLKIHEKRLNLCLCGCGKEVKSGNRYIYGHQWIGKKHSEESKKKNSKNHKGRKHSEETKLKIKLGNKGKVLSEETKRKLSEINKGPKHPNFQHGKKYILGKHLNYKKEECIFGCEEVKQYDLHHEPKLNYNKILEWEGKLINLCHSCHMKVHYNTLKLPEEAGIEWTKEDTEKVLKGEL